MQRSTSVERSLMSPRGSVNRGPTPPHSNSVHVIGFNNNENNMKVNGGVPKIEATNKNVALVSPTHYAVPKNATKIRIQLVPDFHKGKHDMGE